MKWDESEDQIERWVERQYDRLDELYCKDKISKEQYEQQCLLINEEAEKLYTKKFN
jgi:hypothetical protein